MPVGRASFLARLTDLDGATLLTGQVDGDSVTVEVCVGPDAAAGRTWATAFRRVSHLELTIDVVAGEVVGTGVGIGHRRPRRGPVPVTAALGLAAAGAPMLVRLV
ncbi:MAG: hypothetical protein AAGA17_06455 [Actinomycetota bacterium]